MRTILVPIDASIGTDKILSIARSLAQSLSAQVCLLHAIEPMASYVPIGVGMNMISTPVPPPIDTEQIEGSRERLEHLASPLRAAGLHVTCEVTLGFAVDTILERAKSLSTDYIVLGSHGHGALYHLFTGSVVVGVLKRSACPVIVVPVHNPSQSE